MINYDETLKEAILHDILSITEVDDMLKMTRKKLVEKTHPYVINQRTNRRLITTVREEGKLKQITATCEDEMFRKLYQFYFENKRDTTMNDLFSKWKKERLSDKNVNVKTVHRNQEHWDKYYVSNPIIHTPLSKINTKMLNIFFNSVITNYNLSRKEYNNMKGIMIALIRIALDEEIIHTNPMTGLYIKSKFRAIRKKTDGSKLYLNDEYITLVPYLETQNTMQSLCILLMFQLGTRIGEAVALKFSDIEYDRISIVRMEEKKVRYDVEKNKFVADGIHVVERLKKENDCEYRHVQLTKMAKILIESAKQMNPDGEFIFEVNGKRITSSSVTHFLEKYCIEAGVKYKSPHCTRRTTASRLATNGLPLDKIREMLGQVDEKTTLGYIYNPNTEQENLDIMNSALSNF